MSQTSTSLEKSNSPTLSSKASLMNANSIAVINTADHTVIPFSVAIKRMSEILIYKANECTAKVDSLIKDINYRRNFFALDSNGRSQNTYVYISQLSDAN